MALEQKEIILGVTGGIAAYKACTLTSLLAKAGAAVHVVMTREAKAFVSPLTFQALSHRPVHDDLFAEADPKQIAHIDLADRADLIVIAPATANIIAKLAAGIADDMLTTTVLASKAPVWIAPAMNVNMYTHPAVQQNLNKLLEYGYRLIEPGEGQLACGWVGKGRMEEPEAIFQMIEAHFSSKRAHDFAGRRILVTAGPTVEKIDPVRYITNRSSGKMGYAIAEAAAARGAHVTLISGPTALQPPNVAEFVAVETAEEMYRAVTERYDDVDAVVKTAAVSDYRPAVVNAQKIKKAQASWSIDLVPNPDILEELGRRKKKQILIGFAAETENIDQYARKKLHAKNLDMIVANNVARADIGFGSDNNQVTFYFRDGRVKPLAVMSKKQVAEKICDELNRLFASGDGA